jgi:drug/metabolite transporter (DMT)-like permease
MEEQALRYGVVGLVALLLSRRRPILLSARGLRVAGAAVGLFGAPMVASELASGAVPEISRSALFAMVPVVVVMAVAASDEEGGARRFLVPALVGVGGFLLLAPLGFSGSVRGWLMLMVVVLGVVLAGVSSVWLHRLLREVELVDAIAVVCLANAFFLLGCSVVMEQPLWRFGEFASVASISSLVDVVEVVLIVWLLRGMQPVRFAARYLVIPLVTVLESYVLVRPEITVRLVCGTVLLAAGAGLLLFLRGGEDEAMLSLR